MPHAIHVFFEALPSAGSETASAISLSPTSLLLRVSLNAYDTSIFLDPEPRHRLEGLTQGSNPPDRVTNPGNQCITISLRSLGHSHAGSRDAVPCSTRDLSPSMGPPPVAIPWWMILLSPPTPPLDDLVRPKPLPCLDQDPRFPTLPTYYSELLHGFSYFVGGGYTLPSRRGVSDVP